MRDVSNIWCFAKDGKVTWEYLSSHSFFRRIVTDEQLQDIIKKARRKWMMEMEKKGLRLHSWWSHGLSRRDRWESEGFLRAVQICGIEVTCTSAWRILTSLLQWADTRKAARLLPDIVRLTRILNAMRWRSLKRYVRFAANYPDGIGHKKTRIHHQHLISGRGTTGTAFCNEDTYFVLIR